MKVTPQLTADLEEYPELRTLVNAVLRPVVDIMGAHGIASLRRMHKTGVFDHPYVKDVVTPLGVAGMPQPVQAAQYAAGKALLDYLETIGISGMSIEATADEVRSIASLWTGPRKALDPVPDEPAPAGDGLDPKPEPRPEPMQEPVPEAAVAPKPKPKPKPEPEPKPMKKPKPEPTQEPMHQNHTEKEENNGGETAD